MVKKRQKTPIITKQEIGMLSSVQEVFAVAFERRQRSDQQFSLRSWSRELGYKNPSTLSALLSGKRRIKPETAKSLASSLGLDKSSSNFLEVMVMAETAKSPVEREQWRLKLEKISPDSANKLRQTKMDDDAFFLIREWYYSVLLVLAGTEGGVLADHKYIATKLGHGLTATQIEMAVNRLLRLGLVEICNDKIVHKHQNITVEPAKKNIAVRAHHKQMIELALEALDKETREERNIQGSTHGFAPEAYDEAVAIINECHDKLMQLAAAKPGSRVMQMNTQLFSLIAKQDYT